MAAFSSRRRRGVSASITAKADAAAAPSAHFNAAASPAAKATVLATADRKRRGGFSAKARAQLSAVADRRTDASASLSAVARALFQPGTRKVSAAQMESRASVLASPGKLALAAASLEARASIVANGFKDAQIQLTRVIRVPERDRELFIPPKERTIRFTGDDRSLSMERFTKQPREIVDYALVMEDYFDPIYEDFIDDIQIVEISPTGDADDLESGPGNKPVWAGVGDPVHNAQIWIGGGRDGIEYKVTALVTTNVGRVEEVDFLVAVEEQ